MARASGHIEIPSLADDGLFTPEVGDWAEDKYRLVKLYSTLFTKSMHGKWDQLAYVDLFSGPGRSCIRGTQRIIPASPLLALSLNPRFDRYVFCEADKRLLNTLSLRVSRDFQDVDARYLAGDVNEHVPAILAALPQPGPRQRVLAFCFADPYGLRNLRFQTIEQLATRYMDFLVLVPSGYDATRNQVIYRKPGNPTIDRFLGNPEWRPRWEAARAMGRTFDVFMTNEFGESMKRLGYLYEGIANSQVVKGGRKQRLYRLVLFSRNPLGGKFWQQVRKYATGQRSLGF